MLLHTLDRTAEVVGVSQRKLKSLKFRLRRRTLKTAQNGCPFNKRAPLKKNANRSNAALSRKRDDNGKFLNIPIQSKSPIKPSQ